LRYAQDIIRLKVGLGLRLEGIGAEVVLEVEQHERGLAVRAVGLVLRVDVVPEVATVRVAQRHDGVVGVEELR
jgi:hypothetical protein